MSNAKSMAVGLAALTTVLVVAMAATPALAYVGPGAGVSLFGAAIGVLVAIFTALGIILLWPIRMLIKLIRGTRAKSEAAAQAKASEAGETG